MEELPHMDKKRAMDLKLTQGFGLGTNASQDVNSCVAAVFSYTIPCANTDGKATFSRGFGFPEALKSLKWAETCVQCFWYVW